jgi:uncharacterized protein
MNEKKSFTRIGVLSDTHLPECGSLPLQLLNELENVDIIIHVGDFCNEETLKDLQKIAPVIAVYGNMDDDNLKTLLPEKKVIEIEGFSVGIIHGWGPPKGIEKRVLGAFKDVDIIIHGHSHIPHFEKNGDVYIFNPGSTSMNRDGTTTYGILELGETINHQIIRLD